MTYSSICLPIIWGCSDLPDILLLGLLSDRDVLAVGFKLMLDDLSVSAVLHTECVVQYPCDIIFPVKTHTSCFIFNMEDFKDTQLFFFVFFILNYLYKKLTEYCKFQCYPGRLYNV